MSFFTIHFCCIFLLLKAASSVSAEEEVSSRCGIAFTGISKISEAGLIEQITSSHSVDNQITAVKCRTEMGPVIFSHMMVYRYIYEFVPVSLIQLSDGSCSLAYITLSGGCCLPSGCKTGWTFCCLHRVLVQHAGDV